MFPNITVNSLTVLQSANIANLTVSGTNTDILGDLTVHGSSNLIFGIKNTLINLATKTLTVLTSANISNLIAQGSTDVMSNLTVHGTSNLNGNVLIGAPNLDLKNLHLLGNLIVDINTTVANLTNEIMFTRELNFEPGAPPPTLFQGTIVDSPIVNGATFDIGGTYSLVLANASVSSSMDTFAFVVTSVPGMLSLGQATLTYTTLGGVTSYSSIVSLGGHQYRVTFSAPSGNFQTTDRMYIYVTFTQYG